MLVEGAEFKPKLGAHLSLEIKRQTTASLQGVLGAADLSQDRTHNHRFTYRALEQRTKSWPLFNVNCSIEPNGTLK